MRSKSCKIFLIWNNKGYALTHVALNSSPISSSVFSSVHVYLLSLTPHGTSLNHHAFLLSLQRLHARSFFFKDLSFTTTLPSSPLPSSLSSVSSFQILILSLSSLFYFECTNKAPFIFYIWFSCQGRRRKCPFLSYQLSMFFRCFALLYLPFYSLFHYLPLSLPRVLKHIQEHFFTRAKCVSGFIWWDCRLSS